MGQSAKKLMDETRESLERLPCYRCDGFSLLCCLKAQKGYPNIGRECWAFELEPGTGKGEGDE